MSNNKPSMRWNCLEKDLKDAFPDMSGFSPRNIKYMRKFAKCWPDFEIVQQVAAQFHIRRAAFFHLVTV